MPVVTLAYPGVTLIVDAEDAERVRTHGWCLTSNGYPVANIGGKIVLLHRWLLAAEAGQEVIHLNHDQCDCRRANLALVTRSQAMQRQNKRTMAVSLYKGVSYHARSGRWRAMIHPYGRKIHLGYFDEELDAARAYDEAARQYYGDTARLNLPDVSEPAPNPRVGRVRRSSQRGVSFIRPGRWRAVLCANGQRRHLGYYASEDEAAAAWRVVYNSTPK